MLDLIGVKVKVKFGATELQGSVYAYLPEEGLLMLMTVVGPNKLRKFTITRMTKDTQIEQIEDMPEQPLDLHIPAVDVQKLFSSLEEDRQVTGEQIFTEISKTYTVEWAGEDILLPDLEIRVVPPYESARDIRGGASQSAVKRVSGVLAKVRNRLGLATN